MWEWEYCFHQLHALFLYEHFQRKHSTNHASTHKPAAMFAFEGGIPEKLHVVGSELYPDEGNMVLHSRKMFRAVVCGWWKIDICALWELIKFYGSLKLQSYMELHVKLHWFVLLCFTGLHYMMVVVCYHSFTILNSCTKEWLPNNRRGMDLTSCWFELSIIQGSKISECSAN